MATVALLLFVAIAVMPVAATWPWPQWPSNNDTFIKPANGMRSLGDNYNNANFSYNGNDSYYFWMVNGTQGMNAIHITSSPATPYGQLTNTSSTSGRFYVSSTGGHTGEDNVLLLIAINSTNQTDIDRFSIHLDVSGYNFVPQTGADAPPFTDNITYTGDYYNSSTLSRTFNASDFLKNTTGTPSNVSQIWKFAPLNNYPVYGGQDMSIDQPFRFILADLNVGAISTRFTPYYTYLYDNGTVNITYDIMSGPSSSAIISFNTYVFNADASQAKRTVHWINALYKNGGTEPSGWKVTPS